MGFFEKNSPTPDKFARLLMDAIRAAGETRPVHYDSKQFSLSAGEGHLFNLANVYAEYREGSREDRPSMLRRTAKMWMEAGDHVPEELAEVGPDLLPVIRSRSYYELLRYRGDGDGEGFPELPQLAIAEHLTLSLVYDFPHTMASINADNLEAWGISFYEALEIARENLRHKPVQVASSEPAGLYLAVTGDCYDASRLIDLDFIRDLKVKGTHVAMVPNRNRLIVTGSDDENGLTAMASVAEQVLQEPRPLSGVAVQLIDDEWRHWLPPAGHSALPQFRRLFMVSIGQDYAEQKELLDRRHEKTGEDTFVASFSSASKSEDEFFSYCVWPGVPSLLPRTDKIAFIEEKAGPLIADFDRVVGACGELMKPMGWYPERFLVAALPTPAQLAAAGASPLK